LVERIFSSFLSFLSSLSRKSSLLSPRVYT
jgi:hypothetical protein